MVFKSFGLYGAFLAYALFTAGPYVHRRLTVLGALRSYPAGAVYSDEVIAIPDTVHCEDVHYYALSGTLFAACEDNAETRFKWFPALANLDDPEMASRSQGSIHVVDPKTMQSQRLEFENFDGPFITHGIDVIPDRKQPDGAAVYIIAVNHVPETQASGSHGPNARSQLEVFHHVIGSSSVKHLRSVWHPLVKTPNDIFALSPTSIFVTNDHRHRHGLMRSLEDVYSGARWTNVVHLKLDSLNKADPESGVTASIASAPMHNNNGLAHGRSEDEILISSCTSGVLHIGKVSTGGTGNITLVDSVEFNHIVDNPSYFSDPFATPDDDRSGFLEAGLGRAIDLGKTKQDPLGKDPVMVSLARRTAAGRWETQLLFEDDGTRIRSASAAVLLAIDPAKDSQGGGAEKTRKAWLFVTGFSSQSMIAVKVDL